MILFLFSDFIVECIFQEKPGGAGRPFISNLQFFQAGATKYNHYTTTPAQA